MAEVRRQATMHIGAEEVMNHKRAKERRLHNKFSDNKAKREEG